MQARAMVAAEMASDAQNHGRKRMSFVPMHEQLDAFKGAAEARALRRATVRVQRLNQPLLAPNPEGAESPRLPFQNYQPCKPCLNRLYSSVQELSQDHLEERHDDLWQKPEEAANPNCQSLAWAFINQKSNNETMNLWGHRYEVFCVVVVLANVLLDILDSVSSISYVEDNSHLFHAMEVFTLVLFSFDYVVRLWACTASPDYSGVVCGRIRYATKILPFLDLVVILVLGLDLTADSDVSRGFQALRMVRLLRLLALLKVERNTNSFKTILTVVAIKKMELGATLFMALNLLVISSTCMYYVENTEQPDKFSDIPSTMWWSVTALTTVGYGDIFPVTATGKLIGSVVAFLGVAIFALPAGILGSGFVEVLQSSIADEADAQAEEVMDAVDQGSEEIKALRQKVDDLSETVQELQETQKKMIEMQGDVLKRMDEMQSLMRTK